MQMKIEGSRRRRRGSGFQGCESGGVISNMKWTDQRLESLFCIDKLPAPVAAPCPLESASLFYIFEFWQAHFAVCFFMTHRHKKRALEASETFIRL